MAASSFPTLEYYSFLFGCVFLLLVETPSIKGQGNTEGSIRLRRGINSQSGYVEIFHINQWGRVCDTEWDHIDAHVVCKQLGYNGAKFPVTAFPESANLGLPILLDTLRCTGRETSLATCPAGVWGASLDGCQTAKVECTPYVPQYIGCFSDDVDRLLPDYSEQCRLGRQDPRCGGCDFTGKACDSSAMTVDFCIQICCKDNNFIYAGLQAGDECYCGSASAQYARVGRLPEVLCNTQCAGNAAQSCGADYKLDVYDCSSGCEAPAVDNPNLITIPTSVQARLYKTGERIAFACRTGYQLAGEQSISCQPGGPWSAPVPNCVVPTLTLTPFVILPCRLQPSPPQFGQYVPFLSSYLPGATVRLTCNMGYEPSGDLTLTCRNNGVWSIAQHTCQAINCGSLPTFPHAIPSTTAATFGTTVTFTCEAGYQLIDGTPRKTCGVSGSWTGADPKCAGDATCGPPPFPTSGQLLPFKPSYQPGEIVRFSCFNGFRLVGLETTTCQNLGTWSDNVPVCLVVDCGALPVYPLAKPVTLATIFATSVTFECEDDYRFANGTTPFKTCQADGRWMGVDPVCELTTCPPLPVFEGAVPSTTLTVIMTVVTFTCEAGYQLVSTVPAPSKTCISGGIWEGSDPVCQQSGCPTLPNYPNAIRSTNAVSVGTIVTFACREGWINLLDPVIPTKICSGEKQWVGADPNCLYATDCGPLPRYTNAIPSTLRSLLNTDVLYQCEFGYQLVGDRAVKRCTQVGWLGGNPVCKAVNCSRPNLPSGVVTNGTEFTFNSILTFRCEDPNADMMGNETLVCLGTGNWSGIVPNCTTDSTGANTDSSGIPVFVWIIIILLIIIIAIIVVICVYYTVNKEAYKKYNKDSADKSVQINTLGLVPMHGIEIRDPKLDGQNNYGMTADEGVDTGVASNDSDMQDGSLESESNDRFPGNAYAESERSGSVYPHGNNDSGMYPSDPESNSVGTDPSGTSGGAADEAGTSAEAGTSTEATEQTENEPAQKPVDSDKNDKDFIDGMVNSAKEKLDCKVQ